jgi:hypothetical protein
VCNSPLPKCSEREHQLSACLIALVTHQCYRYYVVVIVLLLLLHHAYAASASVVTLALDCALLPVCGVVARSAVVIHVIRVKLLDNKTPATLSYATSGCCHNVRL